jgi:hypothetical protein
VTRDRLKWTFSDDDLCAEIERAKRSSAKHPRSCAAISTWFSTDVDPPNRKAAEALVRQITAFKNPLELFDIAVKERTCGRIGPADPRWRSTECRPRRCS